MKKKPVVLLVALLVVMSLIITGFSMAADDPFIDAGFIQAGKQVAAFDFVLENLDGQPIRLTDYKGNVVMLFFWTTW